MISQTSYPMYDFDQKFTLYGRQVVGIDEAGRGPLAGPVVVAACVLDLKNPIPGINDSKKLSPKTRVGLYEEIVRRAFGWHVQIMDVESIDSLNILNATLTGMFKAAAKLDVARPLFLVDGNRKVSGLDPQVQIVKGDTKSASIAAASILAKVTRDRIMAEFAIVYPEFGFDKHFGYPTKKHFAMLDQFGATEIHRRSFAPVRKAIEQGKIYERQP
jgi:ribonuclease HII